VNRTVGGAPIGRVDPGDAISGSLGFGFALNPRFSYSMGYRHSYIFATTTEIAGSIERSRPLQVGSLTLGMSYRLNPKSALNVAFEVGVTQDAPDIGITVRAPYAF
jgi:long-subunit fatty acid transport protein